MTATPRSVARWVADRLLRPGHATENAAVAAEEATAAVRDQAALDTPSTGPPDFDPSPDR